MWDVTVADSLAPSYLIRAAATERGYVSDLVEINKITKYTNLRTDYSFASFAFETLGGPGKRSLDLIKEICRRLHQSTGSGQEAGLHFKQLLSLSVQRGNAASVLGTFGHAPANVSEGDGGPHGFL